MKNRESSISYGVKAFVEPQRILIRCPYAMSSRCPAFEALMQISHEIDNAKVRKKPMGLEINAGRAFVPHAKDVILSASVNSICKSCYRDKTR
jgi:hypothetical protein